MQEDGHSGTAFLPSCHVWSVDVGTRLIECGPRSLHHAVVLRARPSASSNDSRRRSPAAAESIDRPAAGPAQRRTPASEPVDLGRVARLATRTPVPSADGGRREAACWFVRQFGNESSVFPVELKGGPSIRKRACRTTPCDARVELLNEWLFLRSLAAMIDVRFSRPKTCPGRANGPIR